MKIADMILEEKLKNRMVILIAYKIRKLLVIYITLHNIGSQKSDLKLMHTVA